MQTAGEKTTLDGSTESGADAPVHQIGGVHLLVTLKDCQPDLLNDEARLCDLVRAAAMATGATVLQICSQRFSPQGITVIAVLAESHASLHTYPEANAVFWDCFTCGASCNPDLSIPVLEAALKPQAVARQLVNRELIMI